MQSGVPLAHATKMKKAPGFRQGAFLLPAHPAMGAGSAGTSPLSLPNVSIGGCYFLSPIVAATIVANGVVGRPMSALS